MELRIDKMLTGKWKENCYLISIDNEAIIIDPGDDAARIINILKIKELLPVSILLTHGHYDHIGAVQELKDEYKIPVYLHSGDAKLIRQANLYKNLFSGEKAITIPIIDFDLKDISNLKIRNFDIIIHNTPGHTSGSVCFQFENHLFTGDLIFKSKIGRIDLPGANKIDYKNSLITLSKLNPEINIYPGHGENTVLKFELENNMEFVRIINEN